jgi:hypothetical protein
MKFSTTAAIAALSGLASAAKDERTFAVLRFTNKFLTKGSVDPLVTPNKVSTHAHQVMGGSNFGLGSTGEDLMKSTCTNALIKGDFSNYWFPKLYFHDDKKDNFEEVEVMYVNVYYFFDATNDDIKAFPKGLGIFSGDAMTRVAPAAGASLNLNPLDGDVNPISWVCPRDGGNTEANVPWPKGSDGTKFGMVTSDLGAGVGFPNQNCDRLYSPLRMDVHFPSCYNPEKDLLDYKNNMAFPEVKNGKSDCPKGWIHVPHLFLEVYWETDKFANRWTPGGDSQPFVLSNGDVTGYSSHADFMAGWDEDVLQGIIDNCNAGTEGMDKCPGITVNNEDCTIPNPAGEEEKCTGTMSALPGNNPLSGFSYGAAPDMPSGGGSGSGGSGTTKPKPSQPSTGGSDKPVESPKAPETDEETKPEAPVNAPTTTAGYDTPLPTAEAPVAPVGPVVNVGIEKPEATSEKPEAVSEKPKGKTCKRSKKARKARKAKRAAAKAKREAAMSGGSPAARASSEAIKARQHAQVHQQGVRRHSHGRHH